MAAYRLGLKDRFRESSFESFLAERGVPVTRVLGPDPELLAQASLARLYSACQTWVLLGRALTAGELSCALGHRRLLRHFLRSGNEWGLFVEDDAEPAPELGEFLERLPGRYSTPLFVDLYAPPEAPGCYDGVTDYSMSGVPLRRVPFPRLGACGYIMNRSAALILYGRIGDKRVNSPADWPPVWVGACTFLEVGSPLVHHANTHEGSLLEIARSNLAASTRRRSGSSGGLSQALLAVLRRSGAFGLVRAAFGIPLGYSTLRDSHRIV